jgi:small subunit ribosomal protein S20
MPNTKSAERRVRNSARKELHNKSIKHNLKSLESRFQEVLDTGKREDAAVAFATVVSALDKAAKSGVIHKSKADRKKSRLAVQMNPRASTAK